MIEDGAFLADDTMVASYELGGGWIYAAKTTVGRRAFLGNSGITQPGRRVPDDGLVAVLSATPPKAKRGSSWLGSPPMRLRRRPAEADAATTYDPPLRLKVMRAAVETCRLLPMIVTVAIGLAVLGVLQALARIFGIWWAALCGGLVLLAAGAIAGGDHGRREMACGRPDQGRRISAVVVVRVAQRGRRYVRRDRRGAVVRPRGQRDAGDEPVAARAGRPRRPRHVV